MNILRVYLTGSEAFRDFNRFTSYLHSKNIQYLANRAYMTVETDNFKFTFVEAGDKLRGMSADVVYFDESQRLNHDYCSLLATINTRKNLRKM